MLRNLTSFFILGETPLPTEVYLSDRVSFSPPAPVRGSFVEGAFHSDEGCHSTPPLTDESVAKAVSHTAYPPNCTKQYSEESRTSELIRNSK